VVKEIKGRVQVLLNTGPAGVRVIGDKEDEDFFQKFRRNFETDNFQLRFDGKNLYLRSDMEEEERTILVKTSTQEIIRRLLKERAVMSHEAGWRVFPLFDGNAGFTMLSPSCVKNLINLLKITH
jgi:hypothetical protein